MAFLSKAKLAEEAQRLGIDISDMKYQDQQRAVLAALREEDAEAEGDRIDLTVAEQEEIEETPIVRKTARPVEDVATTARRRSYSEIVDENGNRVNDRITDQDLMAPMRGRKTILSPEYHHGVHQTLGFKEDLGEELRYEAVDYVDDMERSMLDLRGSGEKFSSYKVIGTTGERVVATTGLPLEMAEITFTPDVDLVPRVTWRGRTGYLYKHHSYSNIQDLLIQCGRYDDFKSRFEHEPTVWYANGLLCCDINTVHSLFDRIEREAREGRRGY